MPKWKCPGCRQVFYGWSGRCPKCGIKLKRLTDDKKYRKGNGYPKGRSKISGYRGKF